MTRCRDSREVGVDHVPEDFVSRIHVQEGNRNGDGAERSTPPHARPHTVQASERRRVY